MRGINSASMSSALLRRSSTEWKKRKTQNPKSNPKKMTKRKAPKSWAEEIEELNDPAPQGTQHSVRRVKPSMLTG